MVTIDHDDGFYHKYVVIARQVGRADPSLLQECLRVLVFTPEFVLLEKSLYGPVRAPLLNCADKLTSCRGVTQTLHGTNILLHTWIILQQPFYGEYQLFKHFWVKK